LMAGSGFLDDSHFSRTVWKYGIRVDRSQLLVFDRGQVYGFRVYWGISWNCSIFRPGDGYVLFRQDVSKPVPKPPAKKPKQLNRIPYERYTWHQRIPVRVCAMVLTGASGMAGKTLFVAGVPDEVNAADPLAAYEGRAGGRLWAVSGTDGSKLAEYRLDAPPVWDGVAAASNRLFIATAAGTLLCMAGE